jgi:hypothetical protein
MHLLGLNLPTLQRNCNPSRHPSNPTIINTKINTNTTIMGRWSHLDSDDDRLPPGMSRMGYDADTQTYSYRDSDGSYWEGAPGCKYGKLHRVQNAAPPLPSINIPVDPAGLDQRHRFILHDYDDESEYDPYDSDDNKSYKQGDDEELPTTNAYNNEKKQLQLQLPTFESLTNNPSRPNSPSRPQQQQQQQHQQQQRPHLPDHQPEPSPKSIAERATSSGSGSQKKPSLLKRTGTLSRITRFLSLSSSSSSRARSAAAVSRRATDAGRSQPLAYSEGGGGGGGGGSSGRWPGQVQGDGAGSNSPPRRARVRATTFDEILGVGDRAR